MEHLSFFGNPLGDEGLAALLAPPPLAAAPPPPTGRLTNKLKVLNLGYTQVTNAGCATLAAALNSGALPALEHLYLKGIPASAAAKAAVDEARAKRGLFIQGLIMILSFCSRLAGKWIIPVSHL